jgi:putative transposase
MTILRLFVRASSCALCFAALLVEAWRVVRRLLGLAAPTPHPGPRMHQVRRVSAGWGDCGGSRHPMAKPAWVKSAIFDLAMQLPDAGCRTLANNFNLAYSMANQSVSKTWVANLLKARAAALALARRRSSGRGRFGGSGEPIQRVWGIDLTGLPLKSGESVDVWGILDHGSRTVLQLEPLAKFNSLILLGKLLVAFGEYGLPRAIRSDNASVFWMPVFRATLKLLGVKQQFTQLHSPWQNGRIERFWRTMKETLGTRPVRFRQGLRVIQEQMRFASVEATQSVLSEFRDFYNQSRPHQALSGQMPAMVWNAQVAKRREKIQDRKQHHKQRVQKRQVAREPPMRQ